MQYDNCALLHSIPVLDFFLTFALKNHIFQDPDYVDSDGDGEVDSVDRDDDNDGIPDTDDNDADGDGVPDNRGRISVTMLIHL